MYDFAGASSGTTSSLIMTDETLGSRRHAAAGMDQMEERMGQVVEKSAGKETSGVSWHAF